MDYIMNENKLHQKNSLIKILSVLGISFILGLIFNYFFYRSLLGISVLLYICFILIGLLILSLIYKKKLNKSMIFITVPLLFFFYNGSYKIQRYAYLFKYHNVTISFIDGSKS